MPHKSPDLPPFLTLLLFALIILLPSAVTADTNGTPPQQQPIQLVSRERALSVLGSVNNTILFVDGQIAVAERDRKDLVAAVANLASARGVLKDAVAAFDGGDYVRVVELSSEAARRAQYALVAIPATSLKPAPSQSASVTFNQANSALKSANETVLFVDTQIAEAERARKDVIKPVETLAEARGFLKQASAAFAENDYSGARDLASDATTKAQDALAILSEAKPPEVLTPKVIAVSATAIVSVALVVYFGPIRGRLAAKCQQSPIQYGPVLYPGLLPPSPYQQQNPPPFLPGQAQKQQQPATYYYRQPALRLTAQAQPYYYAAQAPVQPIPVQQQQQQQPLQLQQPFQQQQAARPQQPWQQQQQPLQLQQPFQQQQQPQASRPYYYPTTQPAQYQKPPLPPQKKRQP